MEVISEKYGIIDLHYVIDDRCCTEHTIDGTIAELEDLFTGARWVPMEALDAMDEMKQWLLNFNHEQRNRKVMECIQRIMSELDINLNGGSDSDSEDSDVI